MQFEDQYLREACHLIWGKQKRYNRKGKNKGRHIVKVEDMLLQESCADETKDFMTEEAESVLEKPDTLEDDSDSVDRLAEMLQPDSKDRDTSPANWDTYTSEVHHPTEESSSGVGGFSAVQDEMTERNSPSVVDGSSSMCSRDSVPSVVMNGLTKGIHFQTRKVKNSPSSEAHGQPSASVRDATQPNYAPGSYKAESKSESGVLSLEDLIMELKKHVVTKQKEVGSLWRELNVKDQGDTERLPKEKATGVSSSASSPSVNMPSVVLVKSDDSDSNAASASASASIRKPSSDVYRPTSRNYCRIEI